MNIKKEIFSNTDNMKNKILVFIIGTSFCFSLFFLSNCRKEDPKIITIDKITGSVQKGPFINGTTILMSELNSSLKQTGNVFTSQINDNGGNFEISDISLSAVYVEFSANGYYFDEVFGNISQSQLNLYALSDLGDFSTVNINILTHLEKQRVEILVKQNKSFKEAKKQAQKEILAIFGFEQADMDVSEKLDISVNNESNAILLAISLILQADRSAGELTELLANLSNDIRGDGRLDNEEMKTELRSSVLKLDLPEIRLNLENRYRLLGINAEIPDFEKHMEDFLIFMAQKPTVNTKPAINLNTTTASLQGYVNPNSSGSIVFFQYGLSENLGDSIEATPLEVTGDALVSVSAELTGLLPGTYYYFRIKSENDLGSSYGEILSFYTHPAGDPDPVTDIDGNVYKTVKIGNQFWMAENLKTTKYRNGDEIGTTLTEIVLESTPKYQWVVGGNDSYLADYGRLYTWYSVTDPRNVCPVGWHIPEYSELTELIDFAGGEAVAGNKLREAGTVHWVYYGGTNDFGFSGLPGGFRSEDAEFMQTGEDGYFWSAKEYTTSKAKCIMLSAGEYCYTVILQKKTGVSIRCIMD